ncbi:pyridoxamine 5'-phosphate oxidase family protein [Nocardioides ochotonae]|uniref:pyridoxamine 5'-phosphate oxidase family protein n=1 Tax=Nocardioides ochotonae TaxID=2685869 RepID=UPI00140B137C|nr:pyridoxamine 5'-phosphate oxidase family protein [Nocardioides ochotonae]
MTLPLSPTARTSLGRSPHRAVSERAQLHAFLADGLVAHVGVVVGEGAAAHPVVLPTAYAVDPEGPDEGGTLYLHGSVAARWLRAAVGATICVTVTEVDGVVTARSAFHHSMNYRSAVVIGAAREVLDADERGRALDAIVDHLVPGRAATLRPSTRKELAATIVLAVPLAEASMKARAGGPVDDPEDVAAGTWGGHLPVRRVWDAPVPDADAHGAAPADVRARVGLTPA